jgi:hypothetical protein
MFLVLGVLPFFHSMASFVINGIVKLFSRLFFLVVFLALQLPFLPFLPLLWLGLGR